MIQKRFYYGYDLDSTSFKYGKLLEPIQGQFGIKTTAAGVTIVAAPAGSKPFANAGVGDFIAFYELGDVAPTIRKITAKASDDEITISGANVDLGDGCACWYLWRWRVGTDDDAGWHYAHELAARTLVCDFAAVNAGGGIDMQVEGLPQGGDGPVIVLPSENIAAATSFTRDLPDEFVAFRVGLKGGSSFAGTDDVTISLQGRLLAR